jgi:hypothetical protein
LQDLGVHGGTQVVNVGDEEVLFALVDQFVKETRVGEGFKQVSVARRVPHGDVGVVVFGQGKERFFRDTGVAGLVEGEDLEGLGGVLVDDALGVGVGVERVHQDERNVDTVLVVEVLENGKETSMCSFS